jgi:hypothetical protein
MGRVPYEMGRAEMGRSDRMRGGGTIYWACTLSTAGKMYVEGIEMYVEVRIDVGRAGDKVVSVSAPVWEGGEVVTYLNT